MTADHTRKGSETLHVNADSARGGKQALGFCTKLNSHLSSMLAFPETLGKRPTCSQVFPSVERDCPSLLPEDVMQTAGGELSSTFSLGCGPDMAILTGQSNALTGGRRASVNSVSRALFPQLIHLLQDTGAKAGPKREQMIFIYSPTLLIMFLQRQFSGHL